ncbi:ATP-dependent helicase HrpB [Olivibacter sitiensis]|uniref:ATP-dependent helicase HrpB n=1 Tax=Olivibacter sitiensis TaxID=376470 RepID=UPI0003FA3C5D|nr:ATP-dependent helicase HrpB [Olivibacter sitiensis]
MFLDDLPIYSIIPDVKRKLLEQNTLLVSADPGAGKSTLLPLELLKEPWLADKKIILLEPRRLAAISVAKRMADILGEELGRTIGYRIRFDKKTSIHTRLEVVTEGILTNMLQHDNALEGIGLVIFDEFHERRIHTDLSLALCKEVQQILRPDLRILIMSATLDLANLSAMLGAPLVRCAGRQYPVKINYMGRMLLEDLSAHCAKVVCRAMHETEGDILVFLPGQAEIRTCMQLLEQLVAGQVELHALYGQLSMQEQQRAVLPSAEGKRKVVLSTSIAETSLTIEGVKVVVDTGFTREQIFDPRSGLSQLRTVPISMDIAAQRCGRAGRLAPGTCYRMWSAADEGRMKNFITPEILEADLLPLALHILHWGAYDVQTLTWVSPPPEQRFQQAMSTLEELGAAKNRYITAHGKEMANLPCHPRMAHMLLKVVGSPLLPLATDLAAILDERDPMAQFSSTDIALRMDGLRRARRENRLGAFRKIDQVALFYRRLFGVDPSNAAVDPYDCGLLLSYTFPERVAQAFSGRMGHFKMANGHTAMLDMQDDLSHEPWLVIAHVDARKDYGKVFLAAPISSEQVLKQAHMRDQVCWSKRMGGLVARREWCVGHLLVETKPILHIAENVRVKAVIDAVQAEGADLLDFGDAFLQWQNRVLSLRLWNKDERWPDVRVESLLPLASEWLAPYITDVRKNEDLKRLDLRDILNSWLPYALQVELKQLAPEKIQVPSGSLIALHYRANGEMPVLAARLQEVFGMLDTPTVNSGKQKVVMHLLSPGFKPVQVTTDLRSFWSDTYFEVKKELKRRYPKHEWPENPYDAKPVRGVVKKRG